MTSDWTGYDALLKGKAATVGEVREWNGRKFRKVNNGDWKPLDGTGGNIDPHQAKLQLRHNKHVRAGEGEDVNPSEADYLHGEGYGTHKAHRGEFVISGAGHDKIAREMMRHDQHLPPSHKNVLHEGVEHHLRESHKAKGHDQHTAEELTAGDMADFHGKAHAEYKARDQPGDAGQAAYHATAKVYAEKRKEDAWHRAREAAGHPTARIEKGAPYSDAAKKFWTGSTKSPGQRLKSVARDVVMGPAQTETYPSKGTSSAIGKMQESVKETARQKAAAIAKKPKPGIKPNTTRERAEKEDTNRGASPITHAVADQYSYAGRKIKNKVLEWIKGPDGGAAMPDEATDEELKAALETVGTSYYEKHGRGDSGGAKIYSDQYGKLSKAAKKRGLDCPSL